MSSRTRNTFDKAWEKFRDAESSGNVKDLALGLQWLTDALEDELL